jgi:toxin CcdB
MARFDVYKHPDPELRKTTPFLLDVQNEFLDGLTTRVVIPMRIGSSFVLRARDLNPAFIIEGKEVVLDTAATAAFPSLQLKRPADNLTNAADTVTGALDTLFGSY